MKKTIYKLLALLCLVVISSCKKDKITLNEKLLVTTDFIEVASKSDTYNFEVLANVNLAVQTDADWILLDTIAYAKGKNKIQFRVEKNDEDERSGVISVRINEDQVKEVLVVQESGLVPVFYVSPAGNGDGKSWNSPGNLTTAIENATTGSIIHLTEGIYKPSKTIRNGDNSEESDKTIEISKNISLIGGYPADALPGAEPNSNLYKTIFDGRFESGKQAFHTVTVTASFDTEFKVYLEGITIQGGNATDRSINTTINGVKYSRGHGGGVLIGSANIHMKDVHIIDNKASADKGTGGYAAGMYALTGAQILMENCSVNNNINSSTNGGGVWIVGSTLTAFNTQFNTNSAKGTAGGVHAYPNGQLYLYNCEISGNTNTSYGAGLYIREKSSAILVNCLLIKNKSTSANGGGAVMLYDDCKADVISCTITENEVAGPGAGIYRRSKINNLTLINSVVSGNKQVASSTDVDAYSDNVGILPVIKSAVIAAAVYGEGGTPLPGLSFNPSTMFGATYELIGSNNPALTNGWNAEKLNALGKSYNPSLHEALVSDINGVARTTNVMGAKAK